MSIEILTGAVALVASVIAVFKTYKEVFSKRAILKNDYEFASKVFNGKAIIETNDYLLERWYQALSGTHLSAQEIRFFLENERPLLNLSEYGKAIQYIECDDQEGDMSIKYREKYSDHGKVKRREKLYVGSYVLTAMIAGIPIAFLPVFARYSELGWSSISIILVWSLSFGSIAAICLNDYSKVFFAEKIIKRFKNKS